MGDKRANEKEDGNQMKKFLALFILGALLLTMACAPKPKPKPVNPAGGKKPTEQPAPAVNNGEKPSGETPTIAPGTTDEGKGAGEKPSGGTTPPPGGGEKPGGG